MASNQQTLARPYAKAVFESAVTHNRFDEWQQELQVVSAVINHESIQQNSHKLYENISQVVALVSDMLPSGISDNLKHLLLLLAENKRLLLVPHIYQLFTRMKLQYQKSVHVELINAYPCPEETLEKISAKLTKNLDLTVILKQIIDSSLLAGSIIKMDNSVSDYSLKNQLNQLEKTLLA